MKKTLQTTGIGFVPILLIALIFSVYLSVSLPTSSPPPTVSSTETATLTSTASHYNSLEFTMSMNSSIVKLGYGVEVFVALNNTLESTSNVTGEQEWKVTNQSEAGPNMNCAQNDPFRIEVLKGYYDLNNYTSGTPLVFTVFLSPFGFNQCLFYIRATNSSAPPLFLTYSQNYYIFKPRSSEAQWIAHGFQEANQLAVMNESVLLRPELFSNSTGTFTVVGGDEWGDIAMLHFEVIT